MIGVLFFMTAIAVNAGLMTKGQATGLIGAFMTGTPPSTPTPNPQSPTPKRKTSNPKPETRNPKAG